VAVGGEGFFVPATIKVRLEGLPEVQQQLAAFAASAQTAAKGGAAPVDPTTGATAGVEAMRRATGQALESARQAQTEIKKALGGDLTAEARASYEKLSKEIERDKNKILRTTREARREGGVVQKPIYPEKPSARTSTPTSAPGGRSTAEIRGGGGGGGGDGDGPEKEDAIQRLVRLYGERADVARRSLTTDQHVLDEQLKMEALLHQQRAAYAKKLTDTPEGKQRLGDEARANVAEQNAALLRRQYEVAETRSTGGINLKAQTQAVEAGVAREVAIEQTKIDLEQGNAAKMAEQKVLLDQLNRAVAEEVRKRQNLTQVAGEVLAKERERLAVRAEVRKQETPADRQGAAEDKLAEEARRRDIAGRVRSGEDVGAIAAEKAAVAARQREVAIEQTKIDLEQGNAAKMAEQKVQLDQLNRAVAEEVRKQQNIGEVAGEILAKERQRLAVRAEVRAQQTPQDIQATATDKLAEQARQREIAGAVRKGQDTEALAAEKASTAASQREVSIKRAKIDLEQGAAADIAEEKVLQGEINRQVAAEVRAREDSVAVAREIAAEQKAKEAQAARVTLERSGVDSSGYQGAQLTARAAVLKRAEADTAAAAAARATTAAEIEATAARKVEEAKLRVALRTRERELVKEQVRGGQIEGGTFFQRIQSGIKPSGSKLPAEYLTGGQFLAEKLTRTLGFAVSGGLLAGVTTGLVEMFKEATNLEKALAGVKGQLETTGQLDAFSGLRESIIGISNETGVAASEVAKASQAFIALDNGDAAAAMDDTTAAMKLMAVTGQDLATTLSQVMPVQKAFGLTAEQVGDQVVKTADQYGTSADDVSKFLQKASGVGAILGKNNNEITALGGNLHNVFGTTVEGAADPINKAYDLIAKNTDRLFKILKSNPATAAATQDISRAIGQGDKTGALVALQRASLEMNERQQNALVTQLGSPQDAQVMVGLLQAAAGTIRDVAKAEGEAGKAGGALTSRFEEVKSTLAGAFELIKNAFANIGDALLRSGLGDALKDVASLLAIIVGAVSFVTSAFAGLNDATGHVLGKFAEMALVVTAIVKLQNILAAASKKVTQSGDEQAASTARTTATKEQESVVTGQDAAEQQNLAGARGRAATSGEAAARSSTAVAGAAEEEAVAVNEATVSEERIAVAREEAAASGPLAAGGSGAAGAGAGAERTAGSAGFLGRFGRQGGFLQRAFSGGKYLKPGFAETEAAVEGAEASASGLMASPLLTGAITVAGLLAVKNKYDEMSTEVQAAGDSLTNQLKTATDANVAKVAGMQPDWMDSFQSWFFRAPTIQARGQAEKNWRDAAPALAQLGLAHYEPPKQSEREATDRQNRIDSSTKELNAGFTAFYNDVDKATLGAAAMMTDTGQQMALAAGAAYIPMGTGAGVSDVVHLDTRQMDYGKLREAITKPLSEEEARTPGGQERLALQVKLAEVEKGSEGHTPSQKLQDLQKTLGKETNLKGIIAAAGGDYDKAVGMLNAWGDEQFTPFDELRAKLQSGRTTEATMLAEGQKSIDGARAAAEATSGTEKEGMLAAAAEREKFLKDMIAGGMAVDAAVQDKLDTVLSLTPKSNAAARHQTTMAGKAYADRLADLPNMVAMDIESQQEQIAAITNPDARLAAMNKGITVDPLARQTELEKQIRANPSAVGAVARIALRANKSQEEVIAAIAKRAIDNHQSVQDAVKDYLNEISPPVEHGALQAAADSRQSADVAAFGGIEVPVETIAPTAEKQAVNAIQVNAGKRMAALQVTLAQSSHNKLRTAALNAQEATAQYQDAIRANRIDKSGVTDEKVQEAYAKKIRADQDNADALFDYAQLKKNRAVILANRDPVKENAAQMDIALSALNRARQVNDPFATEEAEQRIMQLQQQAAENQLNIIRGAMSITAARDAEDPLASAQDALRSAEFELANSHGEADREQKEAAVINARRGIQNAISAALTADAQLAITMANLHDDPVRAANVAASEAKRKLDEAIAKGITDRSVLAPLEAQVAETAKQAYLAPINKQIADLDYLYGMEQASLGQYIAGLKIELSRMVYDSQEYRDLNLKIHQLEKTAGQDMQFNLPGNIRLPTLYEARRLNQSTAAGVGYMDNRNIALTFNVNGAQDPALVATQIMNALDASAGGGQLYTPGVSVGAFN
jgi:hypothetical protein